ncbi:DNA-binding GntR family transcriptional regulator [Comamonas sp. 4034]
MPRPRKMPLASASSGPSADNASSLGDTDRQSIESIAKDIATAIIERRLPPGTWLREEALGRVYAVSRTKVRAALVMLAKDKLIENIPDKGCFVSQPSVEEAREVFSVRQLLEAEVVRLFMARAKPRDYQLLAEQIKFERQALHVRSATSTVRERLLGDFHVVLAEATGNRTLSDLVRELVARSSLIAMLYHTSNDPQCSSDEHEELLKLCRSGDVEAAVESMRAHLSRIETSLQLESQPHNRQLDLVNALLKHE